MKAVKPHTVMFSDAALNLIGDGTSGAIFLNLDRQKAGRHTSGAPRCIAARPAEQLQRLRRQAARVRGHRVLLARKVESATAASYGATVLREGERRELIDEWAKFCTDIKRR